MAEQLLAQQAVQLGLVEPHKVDPMRAANRTDLAHKTAAVATQLNSSDQQTQTESINGKDLQICHPLPAASMFSAIYAVGDNPAADIRGANLAGPPWVSMLVRTGVFAEGSNSSTDPAHVVVTDVLAAVRAALHRTRNNRWHSMR